VFRQAPENATLILRPSRRKDEIGIAERELAAMETDIFTMLRQRQHLADLGLAVSKINHDLRNMLASAQLLSDQVVALEDPAIQRLAPRLVLTLDKAIGFAQSVLDYGREAVKPPRPGPVDLRLLLDEAAIDAGVLRHPEILFENRVPDDLVLNVDADQMARVFVNLFRNARQALEGQGAPNERAKVSVESTLEDNQVRVTVRDNGPGLPPRARENLFVAFQGSARSGGTGLGLAIARELVEAHGGQLRHLEGGKGAAFSITLPQAALLAA
jgi:signal transduction histidine kinase